jgi:cytochrome c biogenesis protein CcdA
MSTVFGVITMAILVLVPAFLIYTMVRSIRDERRSSNVKRIWANFGLSLVLCTLFFVSWIGQAVVQWRDYVQQAREHDQPVVAGEYFVEFGEATLENWQSEFLQLFSFVVIAALFIHRGSAESKDSDDRVEAKIDRIVRKLDA